MRSIFVLVFIAYAVTVTAQKKVVNYGSLTGSLGNSEGSLAVDFFHLWKLGKAGKIEAGFGARVSAYFGSDQYYSSAPANLAGDDAKSDSVKFSRAQVNAFNLAINFGYRISTRLGLGLNIDAFGFSFGGQQSGIYIAGNQSQNTTAKPTSFNVLLVGNNDHGMLNSEFYARYFFSEKLAVKVAFQYLFTEYTSDAEVQQQPESNDRFRNKSGMFSLGITKQF